jgi:DNA-binding winged helix-turn-helix (wHTH) protein
MTTSSYARLALYRENPPLHGANRSSPAAADAMLEFGRFRILLRRRQLVADGVPVELGTRAFDLLLVLLEADGSLVTKEELMSRVWPGTVVAEENLKVQIFALRKALGKDRDFIRTEFRRGYRFTAAVRSTLASGASARCDEGALQIKELFPQWIARRPPHGSFRGHSGRRFDLFPPRAPSARVRW